MCVGTFCSLKKHRFVAAMTLEVQRKGSLKKSLSACTRQGWNEWNPAGTEGRQCQLTVLFCEEESNVDQICRNLANEVKVKLYSCPPQKPYFLHPNSLCFSWLHISHAPCVIGRGLWHYASYSCSGDTSLMKAHLESLSQLISPPPGW